jgi:hypothetical protein
MSDGNPKMCIWQQAQKKPSVMHKRNQEKKTRVHISTKEKKKEGEKSAFWYGSVNKTHTPLI